MSGRKTDKLYGRIAAVAAIRAGLANVLVINALDRVTDGHVVARTGGTTTTEVARQLVRRAELSVVTNALNIASELAIRPNLKLVVT